MRPDDAAQAPDIVPVDCRRGQRHLQEVLASREQPVIGTDQFRRCHADQNTATVQNRNGTFGLDSSGRLDPTLALCAECRECGDKPFKCCAKLDENVALGNAAEFVHEKADRGNGTENSDGE
jgi:hypothetical protein